MRLHPAQNLCALLAPAWRGAEGHHSVPVNFDTQSDHQITGTIRETRWVNPHSWMQARSSTATATPNCGWSK